MSLEQVIAENTAAVRDLIAALKAQGLTPTGRAEIMQETQQLPDKTPAQETEAATEQVQYTARQIGEMAPLLVAKCGRPEAEHILKSMGLAKFSEAKTPEQINELGARIAAALPKE